MGELFPDETFSVRELSDALTQLVDTSFAGEIWIRGEISDLSRAKSGHVYFDLIEPGSSDRRISVTLFSSVKATVNASLRSAGGVRMVDGTEVRLRGRVQFYAPRSRISVNMSAIDPEFTLGRLAAARDALLAKLSAEKLLEANGSRPIPMSPVRIGLVTSAESAAFHDVRAELERSRLRWEVLLVDTRVQGTGAEFEIADAVRTADRAGLDVIVLVRGGGSKSDLAPFDHEVVARTIAACRTPVFCGVGHEIDRSVADEVAAKSLKTPTACAQMLVEMATNTIRHAERSWHRIELLGLSRLDRSDADLHNMARRLGDRSRRAIDRATHLLDAHQRNVLVATTDRLRTAERRVTQQTAELRTRPDRVLRHAEGALATRNAIVAANDPRRALERGWTITLDEAGRPVRSVAEVAVGDALRTRVKDGTIVTRVAETLEEDREP